MSDTYYRDREIKFVLSDCVGTGSECDKVLYSTVEIYIGDNKMIHASFKNKEVEIETLDKKYYRERFLFAKRVIETSS